MNDNNGKSELLRIWDALFYSLAGLRAAVREDRAFRTEVYLACVLFPLAIIMPTEGIRKAFLLESMFLVMIMELLNIGLETTIDYISEDYHKLAKKVKDVGSAVVFLCLLNALAMWIWALAYFF